MEKEPDSKKSVFKLPEDDENYPGPEHRVVQRRSGHDRREMVRFELDKEDRRSGKDRRKPKSVWDDRKD